MFHSALKKIKVPKKTKADGKVIPVQRVPAELKRESSNEVIEGRIVMNDLMQGGVGCFVNVPLYRGEKVTLVIEQPKHLFVKGKIVGCFPYVHDTKVIHSEQFKYRAVIRFEFDHSDERDSIKKYCEELYSKKD